MSNYKKLGKDMLLMTIGSLGSKVLAFLFVPFYTAVLTTSEYGISDLITTTVSLCFPLFTLIISESLLQFTLNKEDEISKIWSIGLRIWILGTLAMLLCSPIVLLTPLKEYYIFVVSYYIAYSLYNCLSYFIRGLNKVGVFSIAGIINSVLVIALNLLFLLGMKIGIIGYLLSQIIACFFAGVFIFFAGKIYKYGFGIFKVDRQLQSKMLAYSIPMIPNSISWWIANASDRYILTMFSGVAVTGIYSVAYKIPTIISLFSGIFNSAWRLSANENFGSEESKAFYTDIYSKLTVLLLLLSSFLIVINKPLASILFSKDFYAAWECVPILVVSAVFHSYSDFFGTIYTTSFKTKYLFYSTLMGAGTNIILNFCFIPHFGAIGAALATLISYAVVWIFRLVHSQKILKIKYHLVRDCIGYLIVFVQLVLAEFEWKFEIAVSAVLLLILIILVRKELISIFKMALGKFLKKKI